MSRRYNRRATRPLEDLPNLFTADSRDCDVSFTVEGGRPAKDAKSVESEYAVPDDLTRPQNRLRFMSFGSGSSGNCAYIGTPKNGVLIDAGVDNNQVTRELAKAGIEMSSIRGILLTHDHADHVRYSYALLRRNPHLRLYATPRTIEGILRRHNISRRIKEYHQPIYKEHEVNFGDFRVTPFETSHDGSDNVGFYVEFEKKTFVVATDMGYVTDRADYYIRRAHALMIESNYDDHMLTVGRYKEHLKARIRSLTGHMDNAATARYLTEILTPKLTHIFLCHLSEENNTPEIALNTAVEALRSIGIEPAESTINIEPGTVYITTLPRKESTDLYVF